MQVVQSTVCCFVRKDQVLLVQVEYSNGERKWNGVGGMVDRGEQPIDAVIREIGEETHVVVETKNLAEHAPVDTNNVELHVFTCRVWSGKEIAKDPTLKVFKWYPFDEVPYDTMWSGNQTWLPAVLNSNIR